MIPYLLAALGGYFIGESQKKETDAPKMADGGGVTSEKQVIIDKLLDYEGEDFFVTDNLIGYIREIKIKDGDYTKETIIKKLLEYEGNDFFVTDDLIAFIHQIPTQKMASGGYMADGGEVNWQKALSIERNTKSEAIKNSQMLKSYYGNSAKNFKVVKKGEGWAVSFEYVPNEVLGQMDGMMAKGGVLADGGVVSNMSNKEKGKVFSFLDDYNLSDEAYHWWERFGYTKDEAKDIENSWAISRGYKMSDGGMADGGMMDYEDLRVYVQGVGTIYQGNSLSEATDVFDEYYANNPHAEMVMVDEKYGDEIKWANTSSTNDNDD